MTKYLFFVVLLVGCYNHQKATKQHGRAVATFEDIGADFCARVYPAKDSLIKGDSVIVMDTIYEGGETVFDTITVQGDTVRIVKTVQLPAQIVTRTVHVRDTVIKVNTADLEACRMEKAKLAEVALNEQKRAEKYQGQSTKRGWIIAGLLFAVIVWLYFKLKRKK